MSHAARSTAIIIIVIACLAVGSLTAQPMHPQANTAATVPPQSQRKEKSCLETRNEGLAILRSLTGMHSASQNDVRAVLFETGGGDPAMNGAVLYLLIEEEDFREGNSYLYDPDLNVYQIEKFEVRGKTVFLKVLEHVEVDDNIVTHRVEYSFHFTLDGEGHLNEKITIRRKALGAVKG